MKFRSIKGTRDVLPGESHRWQSVEEAIREVMRTFHYKEIRTPVIEETALFSRGIGELTDIVSKEIYTFTDRGGTSLTLRPEMTASVVRSFLQNNLGEAQPLTKVYYLAPMFRQERPQAGRLRQFHQFGAEAIGGASAAIDAEVITLAVEVYGALGLKEVTLNINSVGCQDCRPAYRTKLQDFLRPSFEKLSPESQARFDRNPLRILDSKDEADRKITRDAPLMKDHLCRECAEHFAELQSALGLMGTPFTIDGRIVRGLDYYTRTAFEILSSGLGSQDALAGGGRYDLLAEQLGGKPTPAVGFAAGIERLLMVLESQKHAYPPEPAPLVYVAGADTEGIAQALKIVASLRRIGVAAETDLLGRSLKAQMREADRQNARFSIVIGAEEIRGQSCTVKEMSNGESTALALGALAEFFLKHQPEASAHTS